MLKREVSIDISKYLCFRPCGERQNSNSCNGFAFELPKFSNVTVESSFFIRVAKWYPKLPTRLTSLPSAKLFGKHLKNVNISELLQIPLPFDKCIRSVVTYVFICIPVILAGNVLNTNVTVSIWEGFKSFAFFRNNHFARDFRIILHSFCIHTFELTYDFNKLFYSILFYSKPWKQLSETRKLVRRPPRLFVLLSVESS